MKIVKRIQGIARWTSIPVLAAFLGFGSGWGERLQAQPSQAPNSWKLGTPMPTARSSAMTGVIGDKVYVIGGYVNNTTDVNVNEVYDTTADAWSTGAAMPTSRHVGASAVVGNILYAIGGERNGNPVTTVEAYDPASDTWSTKASMPVATDSMFAIADNGIIYVVGGFNPGKGRLANLYAYVPATNSWSELSPLKVGKSNSALGLIGSQIISAEGLANSGAATDTEGYNVAGNSWTTLAHAPTARNAPCFGTFGSTLFVAGGNAAGNGTQLASMDAYDAGTNSWTTGLATLPFSLYQGVSAVVNGRLYCIGGVNTGKSGGTYNYVQIYQPDLPPSVLARGVVSASSFGGFSSVSPGSWIEIYGSNLAIDTRGWAGADFHGNNAPTALDGTSVTIGGHQAFVDYISPGQVNALASSNTPTGVQQLTVTTPLGVSSSYSITVNAEEPGFLAPASFQIGGVPYVVALFSDGTYALPAGAIAGVNSRPAKPGDVVTLYGVGFGGVTPNIPAGELAQSLNKLAAPFELSIGGTKASFTYDGLAPGYTGLYQFDVTVPSAVSGNAPLTFTLNGVAGTQTLYLAVSN